MSKDWRHKKDRRYEEHGQRPKLKPMNNNGRKPPRELIDDERSPGDPDGTDDRFDRNEG